MAKKSLNLTVEEPIKERAKYIAKKRGISVSQLFEEAIIREEEQEEFIPRPGSAVEKIMNAISQSKRVDNYDYKKLKMEALEEKYGLR
jgi:antitoxin component of RelBE/YafQ-DinJ toxin-antitoxin module